MDKAIDWPRILQHCDEWTVSRKALYESESARGDDGCWAIPEDPSLTKHRKDTKVLAVDEKSLGRREDRSSLLEYARALKSKRVDFLSPMPPRPYEEALRQLVHIDVMVGVLREEAQERAGQVMKPRLPSPAQVTAAENREKLRARDGVKDVSVAKELGVSDRTVRRYRRHNRESDVEGK